MRFLWPLLFFISAYGMSLQEALDVALKKSPLLQNATIDTKIAKLNQKTANAKRFGHLGLAASYTHYNIPRTLAPLVPPLVTPITTSKDITSAALTYRVTLFDGFANTSEVKISQLGAKIAALKAKLTKTQLLFTIKSLYFDALATKKRIAALQRYLEALKELLRKTELEVSLGKKAKLDLYRVQNEQERAKANLANLQATFNSLKAALAAAIGIKSLQSIEEAKESLAPSNEALSLAIAKLSIQKSHKALTKAKAAYYPKIELLGSYAKNFGQNQEAELWQGGVNLSFTLFDFGLRSAATQKAKLQALKAKNELAQTSLTHQANLIKAKEQIDAAKSLIERYKAQLRLQAKIAQAEKVRYQTGAGDMSDYLAALASLHQAKADLSAAYYELYKAYAYYNFIQESGS